MRNILVVVDMQKDFINGALGTAEAQAIVEPVIEKMKSYQKSDIYLTREMRQSLYKSSWQVFARISASSAMPCC